VKASMPSIAGKTSALLGITDMKLYYQTFETTEGRSHTEVFCEACDKKDQINLGHARELTREVCYDSIDAGPTSEDTGAWMYIQPTCSYCGDSLYEEWFPGQHWSYDLERSDDNE
jgi:hypothetical protein